MQVTLNDDKFNTTTSKATIQESLAEDVPASRSGRTLSEILSLSHPDDLKSYTINKVTPSAWGRRTVVAYSREGGIEFHRKRADDLEHEKASLNQKLGQALRDLQILVEWQTANLVLHAFAQFAWDHVSIPDKAELKANNMSDFLDLYYGRYEPAKRSVAMRIYRKLPDTLHAHMDAIMMSKSSVSTDRKQLAHPEISQEHLEFFLQSLGDGTLNQDPLDVALFEYLKTTSISKENVERAARRGK